MNPIRAVTLNVLDADASARRYRDWFDYRVIHDGVVATDLAVSWRAAGLAGRRHIVVRPASGATSDIGFVEGDPAPSDQLRKTFGWSALEICVTDVMATAASLANGPFEIIGPPSPIATLPTIHAMQVRGPDDEIVYLTQILTNDPSYGLPSPVTAVDHPFICVMACHDERATARWFGDQLGVTVSEPITIPYRTINQAFGLPATTQHRLSTATDRGTIFLEFDQYPSAATARVVGAGQLPPGIALCSFLVDDLDRVPGPWTSPPARRDGPIHEGRRVGVITSPDGALVELIEIETR